MVKLPSFGHPDPSVRMKIGDIAFKGLSPGTRPHNLVEQSRGSPGTLVVSDEEPAVDAIKAAAALDAGVIIPMTRTGEISGVVLLAWVEHQVSRMSTARSGTLAEMLRHMERDPAEMDRGFHHERLNSDHPNMYWCDAGRHVTDRKPCGRHPMSSIEVL